MYPGALHAVIDAMGGARPALVVRGHGLVHVLVPVLRGHRSWCVQIHWGQMGPAVEIRWGQMWQAVEVDRVLVL